MVNHKLSTIKLYYYFSMLKKLASTWKNPKEKLKNIKKRKIKLNLKKEDKY